MENENEWTKATSTTFSAYAYAITAWRGWKARLPGDPVAGDEETPGKKLKKGAPYINNFEKSHDYSVTWEELHKNSSDRIPSKNTAAQRCWVPTKFEENHSQVPFIYFTSNFSWKAKL